MLRALYFSLGLGNVRISYVLSVENSEQVSTEAQNLRGRLTVKTKAQKKGYVWCLLFTLSLTNDITSKVGS